MHFRPLDFAFIIIGIAVGIILSLQIQADPVRRGKFPLEQVQLTKDLFQTFSLEQEELKKQLEEISTKREEATKRIERNTSKENVRTLSRLKVLTAFESTEGIGIRIVLSDNPNVSRPTFSTTNENFVQATDLRDLVNALFLHDANAISINGKRVTPLTPIQSAFDSILVSNVQIAPPFIVEAQGNPVSLEEALKVLQKRKIQQFVDSPVEVKILSVEGQRTLKSLSLSMP